MASADIQPLLDSQPPALPANVARVTADGKPTTHLLDWEMFQTNWFKSNIVATDQRIDAVKAVADGASAAVTTETNARISADGALASQISTVDAKANNATASGQIFFAAMAAPAGAISAYGIFLTAGSAYTGLQMIARSDGTSAIAFNANQFMLTDSGTAQNVFNYSGGVFTFNVPVLIGNTNLADQAVSRAYFDRGSTSATVTIPCRGTGFVEIYAQFEGDGNAYAAIDQFVLRVTDVTAGTTLGDTPINQAQNGTGTGAASRYGATSIAYIRTPPAGNRTYRVNLVRTVTATAPALSGVLIIAKEFSK